MKLTTVLLGLCLLGVSHAEKVDFLSPKDFKQLSGSTVAGAAVSYDGLSNISQPMPITAFSLYSWIQIDPTVADDAKILQLTDNQGLPFYVTWSTLNPMTYTYNGTPHVLGNNGSDSPPNRPANNAWAFVIMGSSGGSSYGMIVLRQPAANVFSVVWTETIAIDSTFSLRGPGDSSSYTVMSM